MGLPGTCLRMLRRAANRKCWYLIFFITTRCNQRCKMCFYRDMDTDSHDTLTLEEIEQIAPQFSNLYQLTLSGGEPLLRQDLPQIIRAFQRHSAVPRITLPSNGQLPELLAERVRQLLVENPQSNINVALSMDGLDGLHDEIRGVPGAFVNMLRSRALLEAMKPEFANLSLVTAITVSRFNWEQMPHLLSHIGGQEDPAQYGIMITRGVPRDANAKGVNVQDFCGLMDQLRALQEPRMGRFAKAWMAVYHHNRRKTLMTGRMVDPCLAGSKLLVLNHNGDLWPCEILQHPENENFPPLPGGFCFGNLRSAGYRLAQLLDSPHGCEIREYIAKRRCSCTFECALLNNFALNPLNYLRAIKEYIVPAPTDGKGASR